ncbi:hypothetical protein BC939DRAFT_501161 [Gamsiella multidivaricata]|uniref:uncharacterized protein n=1 Tax=Gamsiella multidivaricata TaxID=101098 RepID=UPI002220D777|nr:uncharacterized protein BC939DRAFT_501161 [Gamsiella multidivaricata]KAG0367861.1 hypothetical protein BGZ54_003118 [Gamsiella multidivaricata]KAI7827623.1 hypothetical protein BC939DRAFT_501161 [Gamsiella multidivaricata]
MSVPSPRNTTLPLVTSSTCKASLSARSGPLTIKVLSLKDFLCLETRPQFLQEMQESLMEVGTFYIRDHGVPEQVTGGALKAVRDYFALPVEEKKKMLIGNSQHFRGYKLMGNEMTNNEVDHREQLQFAPEQAPIESFIPSVSPDYEGLQGPNQWPLSTLALVPEFKSSILEFMAQLETLSQHLMEAVALSLDLDGSYFKDLFGDSPYYRIKCARYPSVENAATIGCGAHKDTGFLTVLLQDSVGGLQGQDPVTGQWMDTRPVPETFIVTMGESMERLTGGLYNATVHRVLNNTSGQDRYSIPFFFDPALTARIPHRLPVRGLLKRSVSSMSNMTARGMPISISSASSLASLSDTESLNSKDELESLVDALEIKEGSDALASRLGSWSNGEHIFKTVQRCHPEVYSSWYGPKL